MIILVGAEKGGTGKTVMCVNLAGYLASIGRKVLLIDTDRQATAIRWIIQRNNNNEIEHKIDAKAMNGADISAEILRYSHHYDDVIIDSRGADSPELRASLVVADYFLTPVSTSQFDVWTLEHIENLFTQAREHNKNLRAGIVLNKVDLRSSHYKDVIAEFGNLKYLPFTGVAVSRRADYERTQSSGLDVFNKRPANKDAQDEIRQIYGVIYNGKGNESIKEGVIRHSEGTPRLHE